MKKLLIVLMAMIMAFAMASCGGGGGEESGNDYVTPEMYAELSESDWMSMGQEEMEEFLGVAGTVDEESTETWGEGYVVVDFPGVDSDSYLHVLFSQNDDGSWKCSSMQPLGELAD